MMDPLVNTSLNNVGPSSPSKLQQEQPPTSVDQDPLVRDLLSRISKPSFTKLVVDDFRYPDISVEGNALPSSQYMTSSLYAYGCGWTPDKLCRVLQAVLEEGPPQICALEFRFLHLTPQVVPVLLALLASRSWRTVCWIGCTGLDTCGFFESMQAQPCVQEWIWNHCRLPLIGLTCLGAWLSDDDCPMKALHIKRESFQMTTHQDQAEAVSTLWKGIAQNKSLNKLVLNFLSLDNAAARGLGLALGQSRAPFQTLDLGACYLTDYQLGHCILPHLMETQVQHLILVLNACHGQACQVLGEWLQRDGCALQTLNLSHQKVQGLFSTWSLQSEEQQSQQASNNSVYLEPIANALVTNTSLTSLKLSRNQLTTDQVLPLWQVLSRQQNTSLRCLDLNSNELNSSFRPHLLEGLPRLQGLQRLFLLNNSGLLVEPPIVAPTPIPARPPLRAAPVHAAAVGRLPLAPPPVQPSAAPTAVAFGRALAQALSENYSLLTFHIHPAACWSGIPKEVAVQWEYWPALNRVGRSQGLVHPPRDSGGSKSFLYDYPTLAKWVQSIQDPNTEDSQEALRQVLLFGMLQHDPGRIQQLLRS